MLLCNIVNLNLIYFRGCKSWKDRKFFWVNGKKVLKKVSFFLAIG